MTWARTSHRKSAAKDTRTSLNIEGSASIRARNPVTGLAPESAWAGASLEQLERACESASRVAVEFAASPPAARARLLDTIAECIESRAEAIIARTQLETGYARGRVENEFKRTNTQLRLFAAILREGHALDVRIDSAASDLRLMRTALGPVAVFGASNFPLAFSTAGGDTASALAAGCPVVVKGHPAHPGTGEMVAAAIVEAVEQCQFPAGVFSWLIAQGTAVGTALVRHPAIMAVGFTGSRTGGVALTKVAAQRPVPIPVYAEMSSVNPVFLLPAALASRTDTIADAFVDSMALGAGQFCTNPGLLLGIKGVHFDALLARSRAAIAAQTPHYLLSDGIRTAYLEATRKLAARSDVQTMVYQELDGEQGVAAALFVIEAGAFMDDHTLAAEMFGPASIAISCTSSQEMLRVARTLEGQLTTALHVDEADIPLARELISVMQSRVGRVICNEFPTGVAVSPAMVHGGPYPATSDGRSTSVGTAAIERFQRPISYQGVPDALLPDALKNSNPLDLPRREGRPA